MADTPLVSDRAEMHRGPTSPHSVSLRIKQYSQLWIHYGVVLKYKNVYCTKVIKNVLGTEIFFIKLI